MFGLVGSRRGGAAAAAAAAVAPSSGRLVRIGPLAIAVSVAVDPGQALSPGGLLLGTNLRARHMRSGRLLAEHDLGSGVITVTLVNALASAAAAGTSAVPVLSQYAYMDSGTGTTAPTDGDTTLQTQAGPLTRATATITQSQTATTGNHAAKLLYVGTITYLSTLAITEWGLFNQAAQGGSLADRRTFSAYNVQSGDSIAFSFTLSIGSNG